MSKMLKREISSGLYNDNFIVIALTHLLQVCFSVVLDALMIMMIFHLSDLTVLKLSAATLECSPIYRTSRADIINCGFPWYS